MAEFKLKLTNTDEALDRLFQSHDLTPEQTARCDAIRSAGLDLVRVIRANAPASADQVAAIRKVREAVMTAVAAVCCEEPEKAEEPAETVPAGAVAGEVGGFARVSLKPAG